jgi:hypothetical protein
MAQNFDNQRATPHVFVYCGGERAGAFGAPGSPPGFVAESPGAFGVMWRAADVVTKVDASGKVTCSATAVGTKAVTINDASF